MAVEIENIPQSENIEIEGINSENWVQLTLEEKMERILESEKEELTTDDFLMLFNGYDDIKLVNIADNLEEAGINITEQQEDEEKRMAIKTDDKKDGKNLNGPKYKTDKNALVDSNDLFGLYLSDVGGIPLLNAKQEVELSIRIKKGEKAQVTLSEELAEGRMPSKRKQELRHIIEDGSAAREHLVTANTRLVISVANKYRGRGVSFADLISEGNIGLMRSQAKFEYQRGFKFSTYATWWIRQAVTRAVADQGRTVRIPVHMGDQINRMLRATHQLTQFLGRDPTTEELAGDLREEVKKVENMIQVAQRPISLETPTDDESDSILGDFIGDEDSPAPVEVSTKNSLREEIRNALHTIPPREARVLRFRYGIPNGETYTLKEIGRKMGVTRERVRQIEAQALRRLRHPLRKQKLEDYLRE